ncbi:hypothetical protein HYC85_005590 [Camellia sinensis]|uniref:Uncharacterized protein n=1 Tax=Camellia sinensis TaxID=4442 RepID=A0A7J7I0U8_CAMSI|nr:hypothetical protein HYC85_005590 [Camellia sinensis]
MESPYYAPPRMDGSRPSLGFPLGTALLLIVIFSLCGFFSCCYHWDKLQSLRRSFSADTDLEADNAFKARPEPKLAGVDARRSDAKVHSAAVSLRAPTGGKDRPRAAEAAAASHSRAFPGLCTSKLNKEFKTEQTWDKLIPYRVSIHYISDKKRKKRARWVLKKHKMFLTLMLAKASALWFPSMLVCWIEHRHLLSRNLASSIMAR